MCKFEDKLNINGKKLPIDNDGKCLFHSNDLDWKKKNSFYDYIDWLISVYEGDDNSSSIDLSEGIYDASLEQAIMQRITTQGLIEKALVLKKCEVYSDLVIKGGRFSSNIDLSQSRFYGRVSFQNTVMNGITMNSLIFFKDLFMTDVVNNSYLISDKSNYRGGYIANRCTYRKIVQFEGTEFNFAPELNRAFSITNSSFYGPVSFDNAKFNKACIINTVSFFDRTTFLYTNFDCQLSTPSFASVTFDNIIIAESASLLFEGKSDSLIFQNAKDIYFNDLIVEGSVHFEYVNLQKGTDTRVKSYLLELVVNSEYNVVIGKGCVKYFNQTDPKTVEIDKSFRNLLVDVCNTFSKFFELKNNVGIGLQVSQVTDTSITYYYYSDDLIDKDVFLSLIDESSKKMWTVIEVKDQSIDSSDSQQIVAKGIDRLYDGIDVTVDLIAICIKLIARVPAIGFKREIFNKILNAHSMNDTQVIDYSKIESLNINQTILLGIGNEQNVNQ